MLARVVEEADLLDRRWPRERGEMGYISWADAYELLPNADFSGSSAFCGRKVTLHVNETQQRG